MRQCHSLGAQAGEAGRCRVLGGGEQASGRCGVFRPGHLVAEGRSRGSSRSGQRRDATRRQVGSGRGWVSFLGLPLGPAHGDANAAIFPVGQGPGSASPLKTASSSSLLPRLGSASLRPPPPPQAGGHAGRSHQGWRLHVQRLLTQDRGRSQPHPRTARGSKLKHRKPHAIPIPHKQ